MKERIFSCLPPDHPWGRQIHWFDTVGSTNTLAKELAAQGAPQGTAILAGSQTAGRGRMGRSFHSPQGLGIYLSVILRPNCSPAELMHLTCAVGVAMCNAVEAVCGVRPGIKWINDLILDGRKIGGILTELSLSPSAGVDYAVVGIGINCNHTLRDFPEELHSIAGSLSMATGRSLPTERLSAAMLTELETMSRRLLADKAGFMESYRRDCVTLGRSVCVLSDSGIRGIAEDVDEDGALLLRLENGDLKRLNSGEVSVR